MTCLIIIRIYIPAITFARRRIACRMGGRDNKSTGLHLRLYLLSSCVVKFTVMIPSRKFCSLSFLKHFEAFPLLFSFDMFPSSLSSFIGENKLLYVA
jgi:hypothetical protein